MSPRDSAAMLLQAMKDLNIQWTETRAQWRDIKAGEFEQQFLSNLPHDLSKTCEAIKELDQILSKARSDCE